MISVVIATYNGEKYIEALLRSVLSQTLAPDEVLIFDDGSSDGTVGTVTRFIEKNGCDGWRVSVNEENKGYCLNFLEGVNSATGDIIFLADQDDVWYPEKIGKMVQVLRADPDMAALCCACDTIDGDGKIIEAPKNIGVLFSGNDGSIEEFSVERFVGRSFIRGCSVAFKREVLGFVWPMELKGLLSHDWLITFTAALVGKCALLNTRLMGYRCHGENTSFGQRESGEKALQKRIDAIKNSVSGHKVISENFDVYANMTERLKKKLDQHIAFEQKRVDYLENGGVLKLFKCLFALSDYKCYYGSLKGAVRVFLGDISYRKNHNFVSR